MSLWQRILKRFNAGQLRDERGRWTTDGRVTGKVLVSGDGTQKAWNKHVQLTPKAYFRELLNGTPLHVGQLRVRMGPGKLGGRALKYTAWLTDKQGNHAGWLSREFSDDINDGMPVVNHAHFELVPELKGGGIAKRLLGNGMVQYGRMGVGRVYVQAGLSGGGYTWTRFGFLSQPEDWKALKPKIKARLYKIPTRERAAYEKLLSSDNPKTMWVIADSAHGKALLRHTSFWATLEMGDKEQMRRFRAYANRR